jgi:hypothetical protein
MLTLSATVSRGPNTGRPLRLARNRAGQFITAAADGTRHAHDREDAAARAVWAQGHGAFFSPDGRGAHAAFHRPRLSR